MWKLQICDKAEKLLIIDHDKRMDKIIFDDNNRKHIILHKSLLTCIKSCAYICFTNVLKLD